MVHLFRELVLLMQMNASNQTLLTLFERYATLSAYCDQSFALAFERYQAQMHCAKGCASCCQLETVSPLEAVSIAAYLQHLPLKQVAIRDESSTQCVFLMGDGMCAIYPARPLICRTHGMAIQYPDQEEWDACPLNFTDAPLNQIEPQSVLHAESVTTNLLRLNLAFCMIAGHAELAGERVRLRDLRASALPPFLADWLTANPELVRQIGERVNG